MEEIGAFLGALLGLGSDSIGTGQMLLRTLVIYASALAVTRMGEKRFFGESTAFDLVISVILGSVISRAINGGAPFFPTLASSFALIILHWLLAALAFHSDRFGDWIKGQGRPLIRNGEVDWEAMRKSHVTLADLEGALHMEGQVQRTEDVLLAQLERSGKISVIPQPGETRVIACNVEDGVQTIRLEIRS